MNEMNMRRKQLHDNLLELVGVLDENKKDLLNRINEDVFRDYFLPMFAGLIDDSNEERRRQAEWNYLAGTLISEVIVVDPLGQALFNVPAMANTQIFDIAKKDNLSIDDIVAMGQRLENQSPIRAQQFRIQNYSDKVKSMYDSNNKRADDIARWAEIFKRYNVTPRAAATTASNMTAPVDPSNRVFTDQDEIGEE